jgi:hypothetical protein
MASQDVKRVVGTLLGDDQFKADYARDPDRALAGYTLTPNEQAALKQLDLSKLDKANLDLAKDIENDLMKVHSITIS